MGRKISDGSRVSPRSAAMEGMWAPKISIVCPDNCRALRNSLRTSCNSRRIQTSSPCIRNTTSTNSSVEDEFPGVFETRTPQPALPGRPDKFDSWAQLQQFGFQIPWQIQWFWINSTEGSKWVCWLVSRAMMKSLISLRTSRSSKVLIGQWVSRAYSLVGARSGGYNHCIP